jgi:hypothetical protein
MKGEKWLVSFVLGLAPVIGHPGGRRDPLMPLSRCLFFLPSETASGCRPDSRPSFLCLAKEKKAKGREAGMRSLGKAKLRAYQRRPCSPVGLGPTALRCSVFAGRAELATRPAAAALEHPPEVSQRCALRAPCKALRSSTAHKGPKSNTVVASQLPNQHLAAHRRDFRSQQMFGLPLWHGASSAELL